MNSSRRKLALWVLLLVLAVVQVSGCSDKEASVNAEGDVEEIEGDGIEGGGSDVPVLKEDGDSGADTNIQPDVPTPDPEACVPVFPDHLVPTDLSEWTVGSVEDGSALAQLIDDETTRLEGDAAEGMLGDILLGNTLVRFVVQQPTRHLCQCPWGGDIVDADRVRGPGEAGAESLGGLCFLFNLGRTMKGEQIDILSDGSQGCPAIVAVSGPDERNDCIDLVYFAEEFGIEASLPIDPLTDLPVWITSYFILPPKSSTLEIRTALRNEGEENHRFFGGDMLVLGGALEIFQPIASIEGFGILSQFPEPMELVGLRGERVSYVYSSPRVPGDEPGTDKPGSSVLYISGVVATILGNENVLTALLQLLVPDGPLPEGVVDLGPGEVWTLKRYLSVGDGSLASATNDVFARGETPTGFVQGNVMDTDGNGVGGARISFVNNEGVPVTQALSAETDGSFSARLPVDSYSVVAIAPGRQVLEEGEFVVVADEDVVLDLVFSRMSALEIQVHDVEGEPLPAKITLACEGPCPVEPTHLVQDVDIDWNVGARYAFTEADGHLLMPLPAGSYRMVVSRGPEYSLWPLDAKDTLDAVSATQGFLFELAEGETLEVAPMLSRVVDTDDWLSGDFHVHGAQSPDAPVSDRQRLLSFLAEGVDVMVATDHDRITDFAPLNAAIGGEDWLATIAGEELTTFTYGHFNAFPLDHISDSIDGGAVDWAGGSGPSLFPFEIFEALHAHSGEQVVQLNHALGGFFEALDFNPLTGVTLGDPTEYHMPPTTPDPDTGDTGLWSENFTAMELYNGYSLSKLFRLMNYWMIFLNRGLRVTGTAVSDTHLLIDSGSGGPRTFVRMGPQASVASFDEAAFVTAINGGAACGSNGPFVEVSLLGESSTAQVGETLSAEAGASVEMQVEIQTPDWFRVNRVRVFSNAQDIVSEDGWTVSDDLPDPLKDVSIVWDDDDLIPGHQNGSTGLRYHRVVTLSLEATVDAYYIVLVTGEGSTLTPYTLSSGVYPLAFCNPVFVDVNGDGWTPPLDVSSLKKQAPPTRVPRRLRRIENRSDLEELFRKAGEHGHRIHR